MSERGARALVESILKDSRGSVECAVVFTEDGLMVAAKGYSENPGVDPEELSAVSASIAGIVEEFFRPLFRRGVRPERIDVELPGGRHLVIKPWRSRMAVACLTSEDPNLGLVYLVLESGVKKEWELPLTP